MSFFYPYTLNSLHLHSHSRLSIEIIVMKLLPEPSTDDKADKSEEQIVLDEVMQEDSNSWDLDLVPSRRFNSCLFVLPSGFHLTDRLSQDDDGQFDSDDDEDDDDDDIEEEALLESLGSKTQGTSLSFPW